MCLKDKELRGDWKNIADGWKRRCLDHIVTLTDIAKVAEHGDDIENAMSVIRAILKKANFIK